MGAPLTRRDLLGLFVGRPAAGSSGAASPPPPRPSPTHLPGFLRPPGAAAEEELAALCRRCGACREACPYGAILPLGPAYGQAQGTPAILPQGEPCRLCDGLPCTAACPSGALRPLPGGDVRMGTARLDPSACWAHQGQPCDYCAAACPMGPEVLGMVEGRPVLNAEACTGCGMCQWICTATPPAIRILSPTMP